MSVVQKNALVSVEDYLEGEKYAQAKHEYVRGHVYAMVGASRAHNTLVAKHGAQAGPGSVSRTWAATQGAPAVDSDARRGAR
jgi:hypothetical protein